MIGGFREGPVASPSRVGGKKGACGVLVNACAGRRKSGPQGREGSGVSTELEVGVCPANFGHNASERRSHNFLGNGSVNKE